MSLLSIVLPAYNEEQNIANTAKVLGELLEQHGIDYELVFISDGSKDGTFERIKEESAKNPRVRGAEFSRNFGKEAGIFAGLELTTGDAVIVMDCDLQHPPEVIPQMWEKWQQGAEIVEGIKADRGKESLGYKLSAGLFYKIMSKLIKMDMNASSDFKLLDRKVVQVLLELPERNTFFRALTFWAGFRTETVEYEVQERTEQVVLLESDEICHYQCHFLQHTAIAAGDDHGRGIHPVQCDPGDSDPGALSDGNGGGRFYHGDPADPHYWRIYYVKPWCDWPLYCQNL